MRHKLPLEATYTFLIPEKSIGIDFETRRKSQKPTIFHFIPLDQFDDILNKGN